MNISVNSVIAPKELKTIGFDGVDFQFCDFSRYDDMLTQKYADDVMKEYEEIKEAGLLVSQSHLPFWGSHLAPLGDGTYMAFEEYMLPRMIRCIELAAKMRCRTCAVHLYFENDMEKSRKGNIELITKLLPHLEKNGVILSIENIYGPDYSDIYLSAAEDLLYYTDYFDSRYVGVCLDTGHAVLSGQDTLKMLKKLLPKLTALHINTNSGDSDIHSLPYLVSYMEQIDWKKFITVLKESGYNGAFNMELSIPKAGECAVSAFYKFAYEIARYIVR